MRSYFLIVIISLGLLLGKAAYVEEMNTSLFSSGFELSAPINNFSLTGQVFYHTQAPATQIQIELFNSDNDVIAHAQTQSDGSYSFALGQITAFPQRFRVKVTQMQFNIPITVTKWVVVTGTSASVMVETMALTDLSVSELRLANGVASDASGNMRISELPSQVGRIFAQQYDPDDNRIAFPGEFNERLGYDLESTAFASIYVLDTQGRYLSEFAEPVTVTLKIPTKQWPDMRDYVESNGEIEIPTYYFDDESGRWERNESQFFYGKLVDREGAAISDSQLSAIQQRSYSGEVYATFKARHFSTWNCDHPVMGIFSIKTMIEDAKENQCLADATELANAILNTPKAQEALDQFNISPGMFDVEYPEGSINIRVIDSLRQGAMGGYHPNTPSTIYLSQQSLLDRCTDEAVDDLGRNAWLVTMAGAILHEIAHMKAYEFGNGIHEGGFYNGEGYFMEQTIFDNIVRPAVVIRLIDDTFITSYELQAMAGADGDVLINGDITPIPDQIVSQWATPEYWESFYNKSMFKYDTQSDSQPQPPSLSISISTLKNEYALGDDITVDIKFTNHSENTLQLPMTSLSGLPVVFDVGSEDQQSFHHGNHYFYDILSFMETLAPGASKTVQSSPDLDSDAQYGTCLQPSNNPITIQAIDVLHDNYFDDIEPIVSNTINVWCYDIKARLFDAVTGNPLTGNAITSGAAKLFRGNEISGDNLIYDVPFISQDGTFSLPRQPADSGDYLLLIQTNGYDPIQLIIGFNNEPVQYFDAYLEPAAAIALQAGGRIRLDWSAGTQAIFNEHLWLPDGLYHLWSKTPNSNGALENCPWANMTRSTTSLELTLNQLVPGQYQVAIERKAGDWASVRGITIETSNGESFFWPPPLAGTPGDWWHIFSIDGASGAVSTVDQVITEYMPYEQPDTGICVVPQ